MEILYLFSCVEYKVVKKFPSKFLNNPTSVDTKLIVRQNLYMLTIYDEKPALADPK